MEWENKQNQKDPGVAPQPARATFLKKEGLRKTIGANFMYQLPTWYLHNLGIIHNVLDFSFFFVFLRSKINRNKV
jgi:hypothetical protein